MTVKHLAAAAALLLAASAFAGSHYRETFDDGLAQEWQLPPDGFSILPSSTGNLHARLSAERHDGPATSLNAMLDSGPLADFDYGITLAMNGDTSVDLVFRATPDFGYDYGTPQVWRGTGYAFTLVCNVDSDNYRRVSFYQIVDGIRSELVNDALASALRCAGDIESGDRVHVIAHGNVIRLIVNGVEAFRHVVHDVIPSGEVGLMVAGNPYWPLVADFDDVAVRVPLAAAPGARR
jgi:hypothetical protein